MADPIPTRMPWLLPLQAIVITLLAGWVFWPARHGGWIGDDEPYIVDNPLLQEPGRLWKAWFEPGTSIEYYPITQSVQWVQWQLWHNDTLGYHLTNIALHVISALLVWRLFSKLGLRLAWLGGLIFAVHPMMVDSVALVNELKTTLSLPPFLLAMCAWLDYEEKARKRDYVLALGFFLTAMLCKITMATFPVVILLYAWWRRGRIQGKDLLASAPFFAVSLVLCLLTIWSGDWYRDLQATQDDVSELGGFFYRLALIGQIVAFYFSRCFLPVSPLPIYPQWTVDPRAPLQFLPLLVLCGSLFFLWTKRKTWGRPALFGVGFFLIMLAPFSGAKWISYMTGTWILEHLLYIPMLGLIGLVIAGLEQVNAKAPPSLRPIGIGIVALMIALLAGESRVYAGAYKDKMTLWLYTLAHSSGSWMIHCNLGNAYLHEGRLDDAVAEYRKAIEIKPRNAFAHYNWGVALLQVERPDEAIAQFQQALEVDPKFAEARYNMGNAYFRKGEMDAAIAEYQKVVALFPRSFEAYNNMGNAYVQKRDIDEAIAEYQQSLRLDPDNIEAHFNLGNVLAFKGRFDEAMAEYREVLRLNPSDAQAQTNLSEAQEMARKASDAK
jgi:Flp pilus assembly protein TadD